MEFCNILYIVCLYPASTIAKEIIYVNIKIYNVNKLIWQIANAIMNSKKEISIEDSRELSNFQALE